MSNPKKVFNPKKFVKSRITGPVSEEDVIKIKQSYDLIDADGSNQISSEEIFDFFKKNLKVSASQTKIIQDLLTELDEDKSNSIEFKEYLDFMSGVYDENSPNIAFRNLLNKAVEAALKPKVIAVERQKAKTALRSGKKTNFDAQKYVTGTLSIETILELKRAFELLDADESGVVSPKEIIEAFDKYNIMKGDKIIYQVLGDLDKDYSGGLDFEEFLRFMTKKVDSRDTRGEILKSFKYFDANDDGKITWEELKQVALHLGEEMTDDEVREMFRRADLDDDGLITEDDFYNIVTGTGYY